MDLLSNKLNRIATQRLKIYKGEKVNMIGLEDKLYSVILDEDLIGYFVEICE